MQTQDTIVGNETGTLVPCLKEESCLSKGPDAIPMLSLIMDHQCQDGGLYMWSNEKVEILGAQEWFMRNFVLDRSNILVMPSI